jgi:hypothetical protein
VANTKTTLRLADDVRESLVKMAQRNVSSMTTELNRCVRETAVREQRRLRQHDEATAS